MKKENRGRVHYFVKKFMGPNDMRMGAMRASLVDW